MTMPAGTYYIGDLCYVMHNEWDEFCELTIKGHSCLDGEFELHDGRRFATYGTMYGDGTYPTSVGGKCPVDAGLVGCFLIEDILDDERNSVPSECGVIVTFDEPFETSERDGTIKFGHVEVYTADEGDEYYDEDEEC